MEGDDPRVLIEAAKAGDEKAFDALYRLFYTPVFRYIRLRVRDRRQAEDLTQTVFLKVYGALPRFEYGNVAPLAYFFTVARNTVIDHWRKEGRVVYDDDVIAHKRETVAEEKSESYAREVKEVIWQAIEQLTGDQREVIVYKFIHELETKEIATLLNKTEEAIRQLQSRGLKTMRGYFKEHNIDI